MQASAYWFVLCFSSLNARISLDFLFWNLSFMPVMIFVAYDSYYHIYFHWLSKAKILLSTGKNEEFTQTFPVTETLLVSLKISVTPWYVFWNCTSSDGWIPAFMGKKPLADWSLAKIPAKGLPSWTSSLTRQKGRFSFHKWQFLPPDCNVPQISV